MSKLMLRRFLLPAGALLGLLGVLLAPPTGWLARMQIKMAWLNQGEAEVNQLTNPPEPIATTPAMEAVWKLNALCADEAPLTPAEAKEALELCAVGERTDPENAFFPLMRGAVLFGLHRDSEALEVLHLATEKSQFDTYESAAARSVYQQLQARGNQGLTGYTLPLQDVWDAQKMWPYMLSAIYQGTVAHALRQQSDGDLKGAMALRKDLRQLYDFLIQKDPYAAPRIKKIAQLSIDSSIQMGPKLPLEQRPAYYIAFLREQGYASEALAFEKSYAVSKAKIEEHKTNPGQWDSKGEVVTLVYQRLAWGWAGLILLASVMAALSCGLLARLLRFTQGAEVSKKGRIGALLTFLVLVPLIGSVCYGPAEGTVDAFVGETIRPAGMDQGPWFSGLFLALENRWHNFPVVAMLLAPVFLAQVSGGIWALVKRRPLGQGVLGGVWHASIPVASVTLIIWCGGMVWLANEEARQLARFSEVLQSGF